MKYPIGTLVRVKKEYREDYAPRPFEGIVVAHKYNPDYECEENLVEFSIAEPFQLPYFDHELEIGGICEDCEVSHG